MSELIIGSHVSFKSESQLVGSVEEALSYKANTFMFYTGAPQNTMRKSIDKDLTKIAKEMMLKNGINIKNVIVHAPYIINLANNMKLDNHDFAVNFLKQEIKRCESLGICKLVLHPGSHVSHTKEEGIKNIIDGLNKVLTTDQNVYICLETMAGKGTEIGTIDDIKQIIEKVTLNEKLMVCLDTCHLNDAGYDISKFDEFLKEFDEKIGIKKIGCIHINDSKNDVGSHKDRHENFGLGTLGFDNLISVIYNNKLKDVPKILETPYVSESDDSKVRVYPPYLFEIDMIRKKKFYHNFITKIREYYK